MLDGLPRLPVQSREERSELVYAVSLTLLGFLPKILHDAVRGKQFVDGEVFMERDEILEYLFDAGVGCPDRKP